MPAQDPGEASGRMLRTLKMIVLGVLAVALVVVGVANMTPVDLHLLPAAIDADGRWTLHQLPLAGVILLAILIGILIGEIIEWVREHKHRRTARQKRREAERLARENEALKERLDVDDMPKVPVR